MSSSNCCFLTWIQVSQEAGQVAWYSSLFQNFPQFIVIHTVEGIHVINKAEIDVFLELSCFFDDPADIGNLIFGSSAFSKTSLNIWKFLVHILLKPGLENFEHYFTSMWDECNCVVVQSIIKFNSRYIIDLKIKAKIINLSESMREYVHSLGEAVTLSTQEALSIKEINDDNNLDIIRRLSSSTFIKRLFSSLLSATRVVSSPYLRLLIFLPAIFIPACTS